jgi:predicted nucleic acid-binding Zn ribbon protein
MPYKTVTPTAEHPLILFTKTTRNQLQIKKFWHVTIEAHRTTKTVKGKQVDVEIPRLEEVWSTFAQPTTTNPDETSLSWSTPKRITPPNTSFAVIQYSQTDNNVKVNSVLNTSAARALQQLPQKLSDYLEFSTNPTHQFTLPQAHAVYWQLRSWLSNEWETQFLSLWPHIDTKNKANTYTATQTTQTTQTTFPRTIKEAVDVLTQQHTGPTINHEPPKLQWINPQPLISSQVIIPNISLRNIALPLSKPNQPADHAVGLRVTPVGPHNKRREVFFAKPSLPTPKNPTCEPFPVSPLKATVAILFQDTNPLSQTFAQPVIKSINIGNSSEEECANFFLEYQSNMSLDQLAQFEQPSTTNPTTVSPQPQRTPQMPTTLQCSHCGADFHPIRSTSKFCSPRCRIDNHSQGRRKNAPSAISTTNAVTQEQFRQQAATVATLEEKLDQLINLLSKQA